MEEFGVMKRVNKKDAIDGKHVRMKVIASEKRARKMMQKAYVTFATISQYETVE